MENELRIGLLRLQGKNRDNLSPPSGIGEKTMRALMIAVATAMFGSLDFNCGTRGLQDN